MRNITTGELRDAMELFILALTSTLPPELRNRVADRMQELSDQHRTRSPNAGTYGTALADLIRATNPRPPANH